MWSQSGWVTMVTCNGDKAADEDEEAQQDDAGNLEQPHAQHRQSGVTQRYLSLHNSAPMLMS